MYPFYASQQRIANISKAPFASAEKSSTDFLRSAQHYHYVLTYSMNQRKKKLKTLFTVLLLLHNCTIRLNAFTMATVGALEKKKKKCKSSGVLKNFVPFLLPLPTQPEPVTLEWRREKKPVQKVPPNHPTEPSEQALLF